MTDKIAKRTHFKLFMTEEERASGASCLKWCLLFLVLILLPALCQAEDFYIAQSQTGNGSGNTCADAKSASWFNNSGSWGTGSGVIGAGDTVHLCGTITTALTILGSGSTGIPITVIFEPGAKISKTYCGAGGCLSASSRSYIIIEGGTNGIIEATDNGSPSTGHTYQTYSNGIYFNGCQNCEIKNLTIKEMYHRVQSDTTTTAINGGSNNAVSCIEVWGNSSGLSVHDNVLHDCGNGVNIIYPGSTTINTINVYNNDISSVSHGINLGSASSNGTVNNPGFYNNTIHDFSNWLDPADYFHADGIMIWAESTGNVINNPKIYNNHFYGNFNPGSHVTALIFFAMTYGQPFKNPLIYNNLLVTNQGYTANGHITIQGGLLNPIIANNTIVSTGAGYAINIADQSSQNAGIVIRNNISSNIDIYIQLSGGGVSLINNNVYYGGNQRFKVNSIPYSFTGWKALGWDANSIEQNPAFTDSYGLAQSSWAIDRGADLSAYFSNDRIGVLRPQGLQWDIGAYEVRSVAPSPPFLKQPE